LRYRKQANLIPPFLKFPPLPKWLFKLFLLNAKPPKEKAETFTELNTVVPNNVNPTDFDTERENLKKQRKIFLTVLHFAPENKIAGKFKRMTGGNLVYNHMDHHLRQFGV